VVEVEGSFQEEEEEGFRQLVRLVEEGEEEEERYQQVGKHREEQQPQSR
jgi:hypothetical protein